MNNYRYTERSSDLTNLKEQYIIVYKQLNKILDEVIGK